MILSADTIIGHATVVIEAIDAPVAVEAVPAALRRDDLTGGTDLDRMVALAQCKEADVCRALYVARVFDAHRQEGQCL